MKEVVSLKNEIINLQISGFSFILPPSKVDLLHRQPVSTDSYCDRCRPKKNHKSDTCFNWKKQVALTLSADVFC